MGGKGGDAYALQNGSTNRVTSGGAGNPNGKDAWSSEYSDRTNYANNSLHGTGGLIIVYTNNFENNSGIDSRGSSVSTVVNGWPVSSGGGSSGGGSVNIFYKNTLKNIGEIKVNGGTSVASGGNGGQGTVTIGEISTWNFISE